MQNDELSEHVPFLQRPEQQAPAPVAPAVQGLPDVRQVELSGWHLPLAQVPLQQEAELVQVALSAVQLVAVLQTRWAVSHWRLQQSVATAQELPGPMQVETDDVHLWLTSSQAREQHWVSAVHAAPATVQIVPDPPVPADPPAPALPPVPAEPALPPAPEPALPPAPEPEVPPAPAPALPPAPVMPPLVPPFPLAEPAAPAEPPAPAVVPPAPAEPVMPPFPAVADPPPPAVPPDPVVPPAPAAPVVPAAPFPPEPPAPPAPLPPPAPPRAPPLPPLPLPVAALFEPPQPDAAISAASNSAADERFPPTRPSTRTKA